MFTLTIVVCGNAKLKMAFQSKLITVFSRDP